MLISEVMFPLKEKLEPVLSYDWKTMLMSMIHADVCCYGQGIFICSGIDHCISIIVNERP